MNGDNGDDDHSIEKHALIEPRLWAEEIRRESGYQDISQSLAERLARAAVPDERRALHSLLVNEFSMYNNVGEADSALEAYLSEFPVDERAWIQAANIWLNEPRALPAVEQAIALAKESSKFLRESYGVKARIALEMKDNRLLNEAILQMIELGPRKDIIDIGVESDFVERAPEGSIEPEVMEGFRKLYLDYYGRPFAG
ncbi:MAG: hypothetical protein AB7O39_00930 [Flavobacteriaceae bacterium]